MIWPRRGCACERRAASSPTDGARRLIGARCSAPATSTRCPRSRPPTPSCTGSCSKRSRRGSRVCVRNEHDCPAVYLQPRRRLARRPPMLQPVSVATKTLSDYASIVGRPLIDEIHELAQALRGKRVLHVSATSFGGGVAEILMTLVPLMVDVGLKCEWQVIYGREEFFTTTKLMHNALQGSPQGL